MMTNSLLEIWNLGWTKCQMGQATTKNLPFNYFIVPGHNKCSHFSFFFSLRSWWDFVRESFCFGSEAVNKSGEAVRGLVKSPVEFPPA